MTSLFNPKRYALVYVATVLGLMVLGIILDLVAGITLPSGATTLIPAMMAAMVEGQKRAAEGADALSKSEVWAASRGMTYMAATVTGLLLIGMLLVPSFRAVLQVVPLALLGGIVFLQLLLTLLVNRFFLPAGYKNQRKAMDRARQK